MVKLIAFALAIVAATYIGAAARDVFDEAQRFDDSTLFMLDAADVPKVSLKGEHHDGALTHEAPMPTVKRNMPHRNYQPHAAMAPAPTPPPSHCWSRPLGNVADHAAPYSGKTGGTHGYVQECI